MNSYKLALIVAKSAPLRKGLQALLATMPRVELELADDSLSAIKRFTEYPPSLVLLDTGLLGNDIYATLGRVKAEWPQSRCLVLVDDVQQRQKAESAGADVVLLKGFPAAKLFEVIEELVTEHET